MHEARQQFSVVYKNFVNGLSKWGRIGQVQASQNFSCLLVILLSDCNRPPKLFLKIFKLQVNQLHVLASTIILIILSQVLGNFYQRIFVSLYISLSLISMFRERSEHTICIRQFTGAGPSQPPPVRGHRGSHLC